MSIYKKAIPLLARIGLIILSINIILAVFHLPAEVWFFLSVCSVFLFILIVAFFRIPSRLVIGNERSVCSPADGTIVAIEDIYEDEFLNCQCKKISIFMSVFNVHQNRVPVSGKIVYSQYFPGKYMVAWHPKSSLKNERFSTVIETWQGEQILVRQIAGLIARRIICNFGKDDIIYRGDELGFILFGSRVDLFLPPESAIEIKLGDKVKACESILARLQVHYDSKA
jgi:phosphatidylserine decarboxylase